MSTRGCVGFYKTAKAKQFKGVYNHFDSYPTGLGADMYEYLHNNTIDLKKMEKELFQTDDWRSYRSGGLCEYCGKLTTQAHSISGGMGEGIFPDPNCEKHSHEPLTEDSYIQSTQAKYDALFIEWCYIINPVTREVDIYNSMPAKGTHTCTSGDGLRSWESPNYQYIKIATYSIDEEVAEDFWTGVDEASEKLYSKYSKLQND